jgi:putative DNA primase/helicase
MNLPELSIQTRGRWRDILQYIGIDKRYLKNKHGPCPVCDGKDRFRFDDKKGSGSHFCSGCGAGDGVVLVMKYLNLNFKQAANEIRKVVGECRVTKTDNNDDAEKLKKAHTRLKLIQKGLKPVTPFGIVAKYLASRGITKLPEKDVYEHNNIAYYGTPPDGENPITGVFDAMVSRVTDVESKMVTYHITYLSKDGNKIDFAEPRIIVAPIQVSKGSSIKLFQPVDMLGIAEGIESAMSAHIETGYPVWSCCNANHLMHVEIPKSVTDVVIFEDSDKSCEID